MSGAELGLEASVSLAPPPPQPRRCSAATIPPWSAHAVPTSAAAPPATAKPPAAAPMPAAVPNAASPNRAKGPLRCGCGFCSPRSRLCSGGEALGRFSLGHLLAHELLDVSSCSPLHLLGSLPRALEKRLHFAGPAYNLRWSYFVRRGRQAFGRARDAQVPINPIPSPARCVVQVLSVPRDGGGGARQSRCSSRSGLGLLQPPQEARSSWWVQPIVAQRLARVHGPKVRFAVQVERPGPQEVPAGKRYAVVPFICIFVPRCRVHRCVGQRGWLGLAALGIVIQPEMRGSQYAGVAVREIDGQGLALGDVAQDL